MEVSSSFFKLTYDHNPRNASIVDCLALKVDEVYGRQIVTTRALRPGDVVAIETPFFKSLDKNSDLRCVNCFKVIGVEQICTCSAFFCSRGCRKVANQDFHQHECSEFRKLTKDDGFSMMVERSILKCLNICGGIEGLQDLINQNPEPTTIFDLNTVAPSQDLNRKLLLACFSLVCAKPNLIDIQYTSSLLNQHTAISKSYKTHEEKTFLNDFVLKFIGILKRNAYTLSWSSKSGASETACGIFPFASLINHSCSPNLLRVCINDKVAFIASRPIEANEQLFICYQ